MDGDGFDDYVNIAPNGQMTLYRNINNPPNWGQSGIIHTINAPRKEVHLADMSGDGRCDIVYVSSPLLFSAFSEISH